MMRRTSVLLASLLLAGCVDGSASYYIDGSDHALSVRAKQEYFWSDEVELKLVAVRWPECQRQHVLIDVPAAQVEVELYASGDNAYTVRVGKQDWHVETQTCGQAAQGAPGQRLGIFKLDANNKLVFEKTPGG
jgi:hypothetical protein